MISEKYMMIQFLYNINDLKNLKSICELLRLIEVGVVHFSIECKRSIKTL